MVVGPALDTEDLAASAVLDRVAADTADPLPAPPRPRPDGGRLPWVRVARGAPAFVTEDGRDFVPIGHNDALSWIELRGLFRRQDVDGVRAHLRDLRRSGVTVIRMMLECAHARHRLIERPIGCFSANVVRFWDDLVALCEETGMRLLLTPYDTFWMWMRWRHHPLNRVNGGPLDSPARILLDPDARTAIKDRLTFAVERWGGSGALFAWDLWNEIHPAQAEDSAEVFPAFITDLSHHVRRLETRLYGRSHPQTVSLFGPELRWRPHLPLDEPVFRHPDLDFASIHVYAEGAIDDPRNTVDGALAMAEITADSVARTAPGRPFLDTEHGPIHTFKDKKRTLPEAFDDEYFRHMQWAHLAAGGAGGGFRWPNRHPHRLTRGMRRAQSVLADFCGRIHWQRFQRRAAPVDLDRAGVAAVAVSDPSQAVAWVVRRDTLGPDGCVDRRAAPARVAARVPGLDPGEHRVVQVDTLSGEVVRDEVLVHPGGSLTVEVPALVGDRAVAIRRL